MSKKIFVVLADGFEEIEAVTPVDILRRAGFDVLTVALFGNAATGSHGIVISTDRTWNDVADATPDVLVLPGGMPGSKNLGEHAGLQTMARRVADSRTGFLAAICAAPAFTLGPWGLLSGKTATCYPGCETQFPADVQYEPDGVVVDGRIITARGPGVAANFAFALVGQLSDNKAVMELRDQMQYPL